MPPWDGPTLIFLMVVAARNDRLARSLVSLPRSACSKVKTSRSRSGRFGRENFDIILSYRLNIKADAVRPQNAPGTAPGQFRERVVRNVRLF